VGLDLVWTTGITSPAQTPWIQKNGCCRDVPYSLNWVTLTDAKCFNMCYFYFYIYVLHLCNILNMMPNIYLFYHGILMYSSYVYTCQPFTFSLRLLKKPDLTWPVEWPFWCDMSRADKSARSHATPLDLSPGDGHKTMDGSWWINRWIHGSIGSIDGLISNLIRCIMMY